MTLEEAKRIRACNGKGYSTVEFIQALQLTEPNPPIKKGLDTNKETKTIITEDYVSYETAKLLKEKGFNVPCLNYYDFDQTIRTSYDYSGVEGVWANFNEIDDVMCSAPTLQMAMKWLREVYNIAIETEWEHLWYAYIKPMTSKPSEEDYYQCESSKYEEAIEEGIKYCLENLI